LTDQLLKFFIIEKRSFSIIKIDKKHI
jgi:hypothetical protein